MCNFFGFVTAGDGKPMYFDAELRRRIDSGDLNSRSYYPDSHTSIAHYYGYRGGREDDLNKYEYNPFTKTLTVDHRGAANDRDAVLEFCKALDFKTIVPELILKPVINPFEIVPTEITDKHKRLLQQWASVRDSVWDSMRNLAGALVGASVWATVCDSVGDSVCDSVCDSVRATVWTSVWTSVCDSVYAYVGTFLDCPQWRGAYPYQCAVDLWHEGLVPSFDGETWRLHGGPKAAVLYEWAPKH